MKNYLNSEIHGKGFFKRYLAFFIPILILAAISQWSDETMPVISSITSIVQSYLVTLLYLAFFCYMVRFVLFRDKRFGFSGSVGEAAPKFLKWYLLTIITLGIYGPWYIRNMIDYYLNRLDFDGNSGEIQSSPGTLLKYMLLTLYIPVGILCGLFVFLMLRKTGYNYDTWAGIAGQTFLFIVILFLVMIPFMYFYIVWILNLRFGVYRTGFRRSMAETAGFLIPQLLLSIITLFIYYPAAIVKIYRFILSGSSYTDEEGSEKGGFGFDGSTGKGFGLLWGQGLLTAITVGIYAPWAMAKVANWFLNNTYAETEE